MQQGKQQIYSCMLSIRDAEWDHLSSDGFQQPHSSRSAVYSTHCLWLSWLHFTTAALLRLPTVLVSLLSRVLHCSLGFTFTASHGGLLGPDCMDSDPHQLSKTVEPIFMTPRVLMIHASQANTTVLPSYIPSLRSHLAPWYHSVISPFGDPRGLLQMLGRMSRNWNHEHMVSPDLQQTFLISPTICNTHALTDQ